MTVQSVIEWSDHRESMNNHKLVQNFHQAIVEKATAKLERALTENEKQFITLKGGLIALEAIMDSVEFLPKVDLEKYLNAAHM